MWGRGYGGRERDPKGRWVDPVKVSSLLVRWGTTGHSEEREVGEERWEREGGGGTERGEGGKETPMGGGMTSLR